MVFGEAVSRDQLLVSKWGAIRRTQEVIEALALALFAPVKTPRHLVQIAREMLGADDMVDADDLPLKESPNALNAIRVDAEIPHILASGVVHAMVVVAAR